MSWLDSLFGDGEDTSTQTTQYTQLADYPEATGAREDWWQKLQSWGNEPGYGAIPQDWQDIWDLANKQISNYYSGTPTTTGAYDKVKASAARRGVSDSPALQMSLGRVAAEQGGQVSDLAKQQAIAKAEYSEKGRQNWLSSLQSLAGMKPNYAATSQTTTTPTSNDWSSVLGESLGSLLGGSDISSWFSSLFGGSSKLMPSTSYFGVGMGQSPKFGAGYYGGSQ